MSDGSPTFRSADRPAHLRPALIGLVLLGGTLGTAAREALTLAVPSLGSFPLAIFVINVAGSFTLGLLLEGLVAGSAPDRARNLRLFAGTGFLGGFTTYSALATGTEALLSVGDAGTAIVFSVGTLLLGLAAAGVGVAVAGAIRRSAAGA
ncbi:CrcB family protein [Mycetocola sp. 2940]|uniref:fluoride efflux transporter FluC n=1 Tax=Mycetocola sp. 2940 TaxID=3156452 RepID=UPI0033957572